MERFLNYRLTIETIGPLFIGSEENKNIAKSEYAIDGNTLYVFDMRKMFNGLVKYHLDKAYAEKVLQFNQRFYLGSFLEHNGISYDKYKQWIAYSLLLPDNVEIKSNILAFMKDAYSKPYVPGGSLKGAIRTCILNALLLNGENENFATETENALKIHERNGKLINRKAYLSQNASEMETSIFNTLKRKGIKSSDAVNSIFQGLTISDSEPLDTDCLILCPKIDILPTESHKRNQLKNVVRECIKPGTKITFYVHIDSKFFPYDDKQILKFILQNYLNIEEKYLSSFPSTINSNDEYKIYLGGGSGFVTKTCVYSLFDERDRAVKNAGEILDSVDSIKGGKNRTKMGNHLHDFNKYGVAPHTRKSTIIDGKTYDFGLCNICFEPI